MNTESVSAQDLRAFIERIERLEVEAKTIKEDISEIYAEAKGSGFDVKALKKIVALMKKDRDQLAEEESVLDTYRAALNI